MVLFQFDPVRIFQIYVIQLGMGIVYYLIALLILKRDTKRLNQIFSAFYISSASATVVNVIYAPLTTNPTVLVLHFITFYLFAFAWIFLLIFSLILLKSEKVITTNKQFLLILIYGGLLLILAFIPDGIKIDATTDWKPAWSLLFYLYALILVNIFGIIPTAYFSIKIYKKFEDPLLRKKWAYYFLGVAIYFIVFNSTILSNFLNNPIYRLINSLIGLTLFPTAYLLYYGVGRQIQK
ncbi:MAG: hypothetical protein GF383_10505 [Candidatus Lokiarchaeota archaeon]|nr:hypothetical protein [Candidatus Lokiarchaeota archaeon]MBD3341003.1 hypothetical protein [Candidatus Lokiarchaeota archaeon]